MFLAAENASFLRLAATEYTLLRMLANPSAVTLYVFKSSQKRSIFDVFAPFWADPYFRPMRKT